MFLQTDKAMQEAKRVLKPGGLYILSDTGVGPFKMFGVKVDDFIYRHFSNTGDCNVSYMEMTNNYYSLSSLSKN